MTSDKRILWNSQNTQSPSLSHSAHHQDPHMHLAEPFSITLVKTIATLVHITCPMSTRLSFHWRWSTVATPSYRISKMSFSQEVIKLSFCSALKILLPDHRFSSSNLVTAHVLQHHQNFCNQLLQDAVLSWRGDLGTGQNLLSTFENLYIILEMQFTFSDIHSLKFDFWKKKIY